MEGYMETKISAIILAAGLSSRMEQDKLLLNYHGKTLLQCVVDLINGLPVFEKILVTTPFRLEKLLLPPGLRTMVNINPEIGMSESLRLGVLAATGDMYLFMAADQPRLSSEALLSMIDKAKRNPDKIIYPLVEGKPCMPALFPASFREELLSLTGDTGGRVVRLAHPEACLAFDAENPEEYMDIDTEEDYKSLFQNRSTTNF